MALHAFPHGETSIAPNGVDGVGSAELAGFAASDFSRDRADSSVSIVKGAKR